MLEKFRNRAYAKLIAKERHLVPPSFRIYVVPTKFGLGFGVFLAVLFLWVVNHQLNLGYALIFFILTLTIFGILLTTSIISGLIISSGDAKPVFAGECQFFPINLSVKDAKARASFVIKNNDAEEFCAGLSAGANKIIYLKQWAYQRGKAEILPCELSTIAPWGLFVAWQWFRLNSQGWVYPAPIGDLPLPEDFSPTDNGEDNKESAGMEEFIGLRSYKQGDPLSRVAWKQYGRSRELLIKQFAGSSAKKVVLNFSKLKGDTEARLSQISKWIVQCEELRCEYSLILPNKKIEFGLGEAHYHHCMQSLAEF